MFGSTMFGSFVEVLVHDHQAQLRADARVAPRWRWRWPVERLSVGGRLHRVDNERRARAHGLSLGRLHA